MQLPHLGEGMTFVPYTGTGGGVARQAHFSQGQISGEGHKRKFLAHGSQQQGMGALGGRISTDAPRPPAAPPIVRLVQFSQLEPSPYYGLFPPFTVCLSAHCTRNTCAFMRVKLKNKTKKTKKKVR